MGIRNKYAADLTIPHFAVKAVYFIVNVRRSHCQQISARFHILFPILYKSSAAALVPVFFRNAKKIAEVLSEGRKVVFLTLGDPSVYSTFAYLAPQVRSLGFDVVWIPGVTSFCASAAALGQSLCADREELHIIPGGINAGDALSFPGTKVFMKGELDVLLDAIREKGHSARAVENCGTDNERLYNTLEDIPGDAGYYLVTIAKEKEE